MPGGGKRRQPMLGECSRPWFLPCPACLAVIDEGGIGFFFLAVLWVLNAVFVIVASIQASDGKFYRYPITIRFIQ